MDIFSVQPKILQDPAYGIHKYITANGIKFHYVANGTEGKPLMLFLHGYHEVSYHGVFVNHCNLLVTLVLVLMEISITGIQ